MNRQQKVIILLGIAVIMALFAVMIPYTVPSSVAVTIIEVVLLYGSLHVFAEGFYSNLIDGIYDKDPSILTSIVRLRGFTLYSFLTFLYFWLLLGAGLNFAFYITVTTYRVLPLGSLATAFITGTITSASIMFAISNWIINTPRDYALSNPELERTIRWVRSTVFFFFVFAVLVLFIVAIPMIPTEIAYNNPLNKSAVYTSIRLTTGYLALPLAAIISMIHTIYLATALTETSRTK
jgi:hypothetical protein